MTGHSNETNDVWGLRTEEIYLLVFFSPPFAPGTSVFVSISAVHYKCRGRVSRCLNEIRRTDKYDVPVYRDPRPLLACAERHSVPRNAYESRVRFVILRTCTFIPSPPDRLILCAFNSAELPSPIMGSSPLPVSLQSKFQKARPVSRWRDYQGNFNMYVSRLPAISRSFWAQTVWRY